VVEADGEVAGQLDVLALVVADRHPLRAVQEDVRGHQRRVCQERGPGRRLVAPLLLELDHPVQLAGVRRALEQVRQLRVRRHPALHEQRGLVETGGQQQRRRLLHERAQPRRVVRCGHRVQVGDAVEAVGCLLAGGHRAQGAEQVAEGEVAARGEQRELAVHGVLLG
jgi:hypothetical protein